MNRIPLPNGIAALAALILAPDGRLPDAAAAAIQRRPASAIGALLRCHGTCERDLPASAFSVRRDCRRGFAYACRECRAEYQRAKSAATPGAREWKAASERARRAAWKGARPAWLRESVRECSAARRVKVAKGRASA